MKCYNHENIDAVGICKNCGIAVCKNCSSLFKGKLLCNKCREKIKKRKDTLPEEKSLNNTQKLIDNFDHYLALSKKAIGVDTSWSEGVIEHIKVIDMIRKTDNYEALIRKDYFLKAVHITLIAWGLNRRGARLKKFDDFKENILNNIDAISSLKKYELEKLSDLNQIKEQLLSVFNHLNVMESKAKLVSVSKTLAHFIPDLIPPIDYQNVYRFFYGDTSNPPNPRAEAKKFYEILQKFHGIQKKADLSKENHKLEGFNSSVPKMIDNAIWGVNYEKKIKARNNTHNKITYSPHPKNKTGIPVWTMISKVVKELGNEFTSKDIINSVINKYGDVNKGTIRDYIYLLTVNNSSRIHWGYNQKVRIANSKYDILFKNNQNKLELYDSKKHGIWEIIRSKDGFSINLKKI